jgi:hypothetical protein
VFFEVVALAERAKIANVLQTALAVDPVQDFDVLTFTVGKERAHQLRVREYQFVDTVDREIERAIHHLLARMIIASAAHIVGNFNDNFLFFFKN